MTESNAKKEITAKQKTLHCLLRDAKFKLSYFQREYRWEYNQVKELIDDLVNKFRDSYKSDDEPSAVKSYGHYFLGSIIISDKDGEKFIIDGQQRLTTLSLILIHIRRLLYDRQDREDRQKGRIEPMIFSDEHNILSFNIDVEERTKCMTALLDDETLDETGQSESVVNILARFRDVTELFPFNESTDILPYFVSWLIDKVYMVEITTYSDDDAYITFETMNDRGLSLTPTEMLKGYILSNIKDDARRDKVNKTWREQISKLQQIGKMEDAPAIRDWLRSQYARNIRERKRGASPRDFELIATKFHRWVRDNKTDLGLSSDDKFVRFIEEDFVFYNKWYIYLREAAKTIKEGLDAVYYCSQSTFTLQYLVLLAPLRCGESEEVIKRKLRIVSAYLDIFIMRRIWNRRSIGHSNVEYTIYNIMKEIRGKDAYSLVDILQKNLASSETFTTNDQLGLHNRKSNHIRQILARLTSYIEASSGYRSRYEEYIKSGKDKNAYQIEHIWANHYDRHDEFDSETDFSEYRNRIGGLLLLPKKINESYGDLPYEKKRQYYLQENLLARSLHEEAYERNPGFKRFIEDSKLPFKSHNQFSKNDLNERQKLYKEIAEKIWDPERLAREAEL